MVSQEQTKELRARFETLGKCLDIQSKRSQVAAMQAESEAPSFWDDPKAAENFMKKILVTGCNGQVYPTVSILKATDRTTIPTTTNVVAFG